MYNFRILPIQPFVRASYINQFQQNFPPAMTKQLSTFSKIPTLLFTFIKMVKHHWDTQRTIVPNDDALCGAEWSALIVHV